MQLNNFIEGLATLRRYYDDPNGHHVGAERDQVFAYATDHPLPKPDFVKMLRLGWFQTTVGGEPDVSSKKARKLSYGVASNQPPTVSRLTTRRGKCRNR
jgi:hypothetical protein